MPNISPTQEQLAIISTFKETRVLKVNAIAGSGKSSTLRLLAESHVKPSLYLAFNAATVKEAQEKFPEHVTCKTMHSLAMPHTGAKYREKLNKTVSRDKNTLEYVSQLIGFFGIEEYTAANPSIGANTTASLARDTVKQFTFSADKEITSDCVPRTDIKELKEGHEFDAVHYSNCIVELAKRLWAEQTNPQSSAAITHDTYLKLYSLSDPVIDFDTIFVDEAQDLNACVLHILRIQSCKIVYVGDQYQSIYGWRGAVNAMKLVDAPTLHLTQSWRYGEAVAGVAECILQSDNVVVRGNPTIYSRLTEVYDGEYHTEVWRTNASILERAAELIEKGISVSVTVDVKDFIRKIESILALKSGKKPFHDSIAKFTNYADFLEHCKHDTDSFKMEKLSRKRNILPILYTIDKNKQSKNNARVILLTTHGAKGLEWNNVIVGNDFKLGKKGGLIAGMHEQERNMLYVACTRAKQKLMLPWELMSYYNEYTGESET
jgi:superfamily I DNA/RNA helicase